MRHWITQILVILFVSAVVAVAINAGRTNGIAFIGNWPSGTRSGDEPIEPPSAEEGDPPFLTIDDAVAQYQNADIIFIDSRDPEDYEYGHIRRAISIPFDYLDEYWDGVIADLDREARYVVYCSGSECETSLHLGRYLQDLGFEHISVFYGGWSEWEDNNLPVTREADSEGGEG